MHSSCFYNKQTYEAVVVKDKDFDGLVYYYAYYKEYKSIKGMSNDESVAIADLKKAFKSCLIEILKDNEKIIEPKKEVSDKTKNYAITIKENIMQK